MERKTVIRIIFPARGQTAVCPNSVKGFILIIGQNPANSLEWAWLSIIRLEVHLTNHYAGGHL